MPAYEATASARYVSLAPTRGAAYVSRATFRIGVSHDRILLHIALPTRSACRDRSSVTAPDAVAVAPRVADSVSPTADRAYCRQVLPRVSRTFAANIGVLRGSMAGTVEVAYLLCRAADALEDSWPGAPGEVGARFDTFIEALGGNGAAALALAAAAGALGPGPADLELVAHLPSVLRVYAALEPNDRSTVAHAVTLMAHGMRRYAVRAAARGGGPTDPPPYLDTEAELHDYCFVVAGCVGVMLTRLHASRSPAKDPEIDVELLQLAPKVGEALQLTNILLDWPRDVRRGRCYVPAEWLAEYQLAPRELVDPSRVGARAAARRLEALARAALGEVPEYLERIPSRHWRYRMFCMWPALWALASLNEAHRDTAFPYGETRPRLARADVKRIATRAMIGGHTRFGVRRLFAELS